MTNLEVRNFAYDTIASYLFEYHSDFGAFVYDYIRQGGTIESCVESFLKKYDYRIINVRDDLNRIAIEEVEGTFAEQIKVFNRACDIIVDTMGVAELYRPMEVVEMTNHRDNYTLGFITLEECTNKIVDKIASIFVRPSINLIDKTLDMVGLPKFVDCVDTKSIYLGR